MSGLWDWSVRAWAAPGVGETCVELQDAAGQNAPLLLWAAWAARTGRAVDEDALGRSHHGLLSSGRCLLVPGTSKPRPGTSVTAPRGASSG